MIAFFSRINRNESTYLRSNRDKRCLVFTTDDLQKGAIDLIRIYVRPQAKNRPFTTPVGKVGLIGWEWLQREVDIFATFQVSDYRPKERPNAVRVIHEKTNEENWIPLFDEEAGAPFYPELMAELDLIKADAHRGSDAA